MWAGSILFTSAYVMLVIKHPKNPQGFHQEKEFIFNYLSGFRVLVLHFSFIVIQFERITLMWDMRIIWQRKWKKAVKP